MSFATWKKRISQQVWLQNSQKKKTIPNSDQRITWSSDAVRKGFTMDCDELRKIVSNGSWEIFGNECNSVQNESETMKLLFLFEQITACNRRGEFASARKFLIQYQLLLPKVQDCYIFEVLGLYSQAVLKRASGNFKALKDVLTQALSKAEQIEPGLVTATVYIFGYNSMIRITNTILFPSIPNPQYKKYLNGRLTITLITPNRPSRCVSWNYNHIFVAAVSDLRYLLDPLTETQT